MNPILSFSIQKYTIDVIEVDKELIGIVIKGPSVKTYIPPIVSRNNGKVQVPKYLIEQVPGLKEFEEIEFIQTKTSKSEKQ